jgi:hypothetical protein
MQFSDLLIVLTLFSVLFQEDVEETYIMVKPDGIQRGLVSVFAFHFFSSSDFEVKLCILELYGALNVISLHYLGLNYECMIHLMFLGRRNHFSL